jgi:hypothetical protein
MKTILIIFTLSLVLTQLCYSQNRPDSIHNCGTVSRISGELIADETWLNYNKTEGVIHCYNKSVAKEVITAHKQLISRYAWLWIKDGKKKYKAYIIYFQIADSSFIKEWIKNNL